MKKNTKLIVSIALDLFGMGSYILPGLGEVTDAIFAWVEAGWIYYAYKSFPGAIGGFAEEMLPGTDIIPACTITHFLTKGGEK